MTKIKIGIDLQESNLMGADLRRGDLSEAILSGANLSWANLFYERVGARRLATCEYLESATIPYGQKYED